MPREFKDPLWPEPDKPKRGLPRPPMFDIEEEKPNELEPWIVDPENQPAIPPKGGPEGPMGPMFAKLPRPQQRASVDQALIDLMLQRGDRPMDLDLRDKEHAAFSRYMLDKLGLLGPPVVATSVPAYSAVKGLAQSVGMMRDATPASLREVKAGLSPLWGGMRVR